MRDHSKVHLIVAEANKDFLLAQYSALRVEVMERLKELWQLEKFALGGATAIAAWLLVNADKGAPPLAWWLPFALVIMCLLRFIAGMYHLCWRLGKYLKATEAAFLEDQEGWETWFRSQLPNETIAFVVVWTLAVGATLAFPCYRTEAEAALRSKPKGAIGDEKSKRDVQENPRTTTLPKRAEGAAHK